jgi:hypothetical protein
MKPVKQLVRVLHGSHLYGTNTPTSDLDFKGVHLPSGEAIMLGRPENVIDNSVVVKNEAGKNQKESVDEQSYSLQKFFEMLAKGDTVATEILFARPLVQAPSWNNIQKIGQSLLNRQAKGFVGYCQRQAAKYGIKGSRMAAVKDLLEMLTIVRLGRDMNARLSKVEPELRRWSEGREHIKWENIPNPDGSENWHIDCCDRKMPMNALISEAAKVYQKVWDNYGERARAAMTNEGIDWKAVSHAMRVAGQASELLLHGRLTFPRPDAGYLLAIKEGKLPYSEISGELEWAVQNIESVAAMSKLPEETDRSIVDRAVLHYYKGQVL